LNLDETEEAVKKLARNYQVSNPGGMKRPIINGAGVYYEII
jgi:hypothetical protein